jgi:lysozyme family protein
MIQISRLIELNQARWAAMSVTPSLLAAVDAVSGRLAATDAKARYETVADQTSVPWFIIAVIHEREASQSWHANLAQGDPWDAVSIHVPAGRGPFASWEAAAVDALVNCPPKAAQWRDWSVGGALTLLEEYNGLGYAARSVPSPYVWASTNQYVKGKYVADGHYDPNAVDHQFGCAALLNRMMAIDPTIRFA